MGPSRAAVAATVIVSALAACGAPTPDVADLTLVTALPKEAGPGYESTLEEAGIAAGYYYQPEISDCGSAVVDATREWAARHDFEATGSEVEARQATLRLTSDGLPGSSLVVRYSVSSDHARARLRITHELGDGGGTHSPERLLALGVQELIEAQLSAARCSAGG